MVVAAAESTPQVGCVQMEHGQVAWWVNQYTGDGGGVHACEVGINILSPVEW